MAEMSLEQRRAIAMASARARMAQADATQPVAAPQVSSAPQQQVGPAPYHKVGMAEMAGRGVTAGLSDYAAAGGKYIGDKLGGAILKASGKDPTLNGRTYGDLSYEDALQQVRGANSEFRDESPVQAYGAEIAGGIASPLLRGAAKVGEAGLSKVASLVGRQVPRYLGYGVQAGSQGLAAGLGNAQNERGGVPTVKDLAKSGGVGGGTGFAFGVTIPAVAEGAAKSARAVTDIWRRPAAMTQQQIQAASQAAYKAAEDAGVVVKPEAFKQFVDDLPSQLEGFRPRLAPKAADVIAEMKGDVEAGKPITLDLLDELRKVARGASKTTDRNEIRLISSIVDKLDDFIDDLKPQQLLAGDSEKAVSALKEARDLWRTNMKLRNIDDIVEIGENLNDTNWTRNQFRSIVRKPKLFNQYSEEEQKMIKQLAQTGKMENLARMQPFRGVQMAAPHIAQIGQERKAAALQDLIARGGNSPVRPSPIPLPVLEALSKSAVPATSPFSTRSGASNQRP